MKRWMIGIVGCLCLWNGTCNAGVFDRASVGYGYHFAGDTDIKMIRLGLQRDWKRHWFPLGDWYLSGYWEVALAYWHSAAGTMDSSHLWELGVRLVLQYRRMPFANSFQPFFEFGSGPELLSRTRIDNKDISSAFQFGSNIGFGAYFGNGQRYDLEYRLFHISNGGIRNPNPGVNINVVRFGYRF